MKKKVGFIVNPVAGIGGSVGLKGSDGIDIQNEAWKRGAVKKSGFKAIEALKILLEYEEEVTIYTAPGEMGESLALELGLTPEVVGNVEFPSKASDTEAIAAQIAKLGIDVLLFAGGDGTARNICSAIDESIPVIGIPAGVKIHSAVYATSPSVQQVRHFFLAYMGKFQHAQQKLWILTKMNTEVGAYKQNFMVIYQFLFCVA